LTFNYLLTFIHTFIPLRLADHANIYPTILFPLLHQVPTDRSKLMMGRKLLVLVNLVRGKLARGNLLLEHKVHLGKRAVLGLRKAKEAPERGEDGKTAPEECLFVDPVSHHHPDTQSIWGEETAQLTVLPFAFHAVGLMKYGCRTPPMMLPT
jgi:hypothetical protein